MFFYSRSARKVITSRQTMPHNGVQLCRYVTHTKNWSPNSIMENPRITSASTCQLFQLINCTFRLNPTSIYLERHDRFDSKGEIKNLCFIKAALPDKFRRTRGGGGTKRNLTKMTRKKRKQHLRIATKLYISNLFPPLCIPHYIYGVS